MLGDRVEVVLDEVEDVQGGIVIPDIAQPAAEWGRVSEVGPKAGDTVPGDRVYVQRNVGTRLTRNGVSIVIVREGQILARDGEL